MPGGQNPSSTPPLPPLPPAEAVVEPLLVSSVELEAPPTVVEVVVAWVPPPKPLDTEAVDKVSLVLGRPPTLLTSLPVLEVLEVPPAPVTLVLAPLLEEVVAVVPSLVELLVEIVPGPVVPRVPDIVTDELSADNPSVAIDVVAAEVSKAGPPLFEDGFASEQPPKTAPRVRAPRQSTRERSRGKRHIVLKVDLARFARSLFSTNTQDSVDLL
jgi:hypothetical protein